MILKFENFRIIKLKVSFDGTSGKGLVNIPISIHDESVGVEFLLEQDEYFYELFYRVTDNLVSSDNSTTYLQLGINTDSVDDILDNTSGLLDTLNSNASGKKVEPKYVKATDSRRIELTPIGNNITSGSIELTFVIGRNEHSGCN